jgi:hypothetical protein
LTLVIVASRAPNHIFKVVTALLLKPLPYPIAIVSCDRRDKIVLQDTKKRSHVCAL